MTQPRESLRDIALELVEMWHNAQEAIHYCDDASQISLTQLDNDRANYLARLDAAEDDEVERLRAAWEEVKDFLNVKDLLWLEHHLPETWAILEGEHEQQSA